MPTNDRDDIEATLRDYMEGMTFGHRQRLEKAFHPKMSEIGYFQGALLWNDRSQFIAMCEDMAAPDAVPLWKILNLTIAGDIASAHIEDEWAGMSFDDFLLLVRGDEGWQIVAKTFHIRAA